MMNIYESGEDYLETIYKLNEEHGHVRSIDIARELNYSKPSVSRAMSILKERGLIEITDREITLTEEGEKIASNIYERHRYLQGFLQELGLMRRRPNMMPAVWNMCSVRTVTGC